MALAQKLGNKYETARAAVRVKTLTIKVNDAEFDLKVRIPVKREMEEILAKISNPESEKVNKIYEELSEPLRKSFAEQEFVDAMNKTDDLKISITDNDVVLNGTSIRQIAHMTAIWHYQIEKFFSLLVTETGEPITETYEEIAEEFPEEVIREIIRKIDEAIRPNYKDTKKN